MKPSTRIHTTPRLCDAVMLHAVPPMLTGEADAYVDADDVGADIEAAEALVIDRDPHGDHKLRAVPRGTHYPPIRRFFQPHPTFEGCGNSRGIR